MTDTTEDFKKYLPRYLSSESTKDLLGELKQFPDNINKKFYSHSLNISNKIYQGDGLKGFLYLELPDTKISECKAMVLSNTCDIDLENKRSLFKSKIIYSPIISLNKYREILKNNHKDTEINNHIEAIRKQSITQIFYLPQGSILDDEYIVFLDRLLHCKNNAIDRTKISERKMFSLSNYGFYIFLFKLSIHFNRFQEGIDRDKNISI
ncbi:hypothetical protein MCHI_001995 [Candidatus Magnetoovum chiemensis]|nr:hypothetical protein MCHI_001995 [Candidatus Magnetoovum chiemensis]